MTLDNEPTTNNDNDNEPTTQNKTLSQTILNKPIYFSEDWHTGIGGGLWSTGLAMSRYFSQHSTFVRRNLLKLPLKRRGGISVLELGSGNGFLSVCFLALAGDLIREMTITDTMDHLCLVERTLGENDHLIRRLDDEDKTGEDVDSSESLWKVVDSSNPEGIIRILEHKWGKFDDDTTNNKPPGREDKYDFIFGSDVAYREDLYLPLLTSLDHYSHDDTVMLLGVTMNDTDPSFFDLLDEMGFRYGRVAEYMMDEDFRGKTFGLFAIERRKRMNSVD